MNEKLLLFQKDKNTVNQSINGFLALALEARKFTFLLVVLSISVIGYGQSGPAGISNGLDLWLDASDLDADGNVEGTSENNLSGSNDVQEWRDKSGQNNHVSAPGSSNDPLYIATDAAFNNRAVVDFDAGEYLFTNCGDWDDTHTVFVVCRQQATMPANSAILTFGLGSSSGVDNIAQIGVDTAGTHIAYQTESSGTIFQSLFGTQADALTGPTLLTATRALPDVITTYDNGTPSATLTSTTGQSIHRYYLNADKSTTATNDCQIAEIIVYDRVLTKSEIERIHAYLSCKYATDFGGAAPGGVDPCDVSLWMRADEGVGLTGSDVNSWADQSTHGFSGTATATEEPLYNLMDNNFNPSMTFDTTNSDALSLGAITASDGLMMAANDFSLYTVAFVDPGTDGVLFADRLCKNANGYHLRFNSATNSWKWEAGRAASGSYTSDDSTSVETLNTTTDYSLIGMTHTGNNYTLKTHQGNSATGMTTTDVSYTNTGNERWIGKEATCTSTNFHGNLSEIIAIKGAVTATEDTKIRSYLGVKYGLSLNSSVTNYLASDGTVIWDNTVSTYWNDVAGIGQDDGSLLDQRISKSQDKSGIVTIASDNDFASANNDAARTSLGDGNFLLWGNDNTAASGAWTTTAAPTGYARMAERWRVDETGTVGAVNIQVDVDDVDNDVPNFFGDLYFIHGSNLSSATPTLMTETAPGSGIWTITGIDFADGDFFSFAVDNRLLVEYTSPSSSTVDESVLGPFTNIVHSGIVNIATSYTIVATGTGGAVAGSDYSYTNQTINVPAGDYTTPVVSAISPLPTLIQDTNIEGNEIVQFSITPGAGTVVGDADASGTQFGTHSLTITDDDAYNISINKTSDGDEGGPLDATFDVFVVGGSNPTTISGTITWTGTATGGADFDNSVTSFSFPPGTTSQTINLNTSSATYDDGLLEGTETIIGTISGLSATTGTAVTAVASDTAFISDDEVTGILVSIDTVTSAGTTQEGITPLQYVISLDGGVVNNSGSAITGTIAYSGTATPGGAADYNSVGTFSIPNGVNSTTVTINTLPDLFVELTETIIATITVTGGVGAANPSANSATAFIIDEDAPNLTFSISVVGGGSGVTEGVDPFIQYNIVMDGGKINGTGGDLTGTIAPTGSATSLADYTLPGSGTTFIIANGASSGIYQVDIVNDGTSEVTETLIITIASTTMGSPSATNNSVTQNIFDDDSGSLLIAIGSPTDTTESPVGTPFVSFEVSIVVGGTAASDITGTINYTFGPIGTAEPGVDFTAAYGYTIPAGNTSTTVTLPVINDGLTEPTESVIANLTGSPSLGAYGSTTSTALIYDDDAANLTISIDSLSSGYEENQVSVRYVVSLDFGAVNGTGSSITGNVQYGGNATNGATGDYVPQAGSATQFEILNGQSTDTLTLLVNDELLIEYMDSVYAIISSPSLGTISQDSSLAFIHDNDYDSLSLSIVGSATNGAEGGSPANFTISIDNGYSNGLGVPITGTLAFSGTATAGVDFSNFTTFAIPDGDAFVIRDLPVTDDPSLELQEYVIATLSSPFGPINPNATSDTVYIDDNDLANAQIQITASDGVEMPNPYHPVFVVGFVGGLVNETGVDITGTISLAGDATEGTDYTGVFTFTIANDSVQDVIPMVIIDDLLIENDEQIIATISNPSQASLSTTITATAKILDDDTDDDNDGLSDLVDPIVGNIDSDCDGIFDGCDVDADGDGSPDDGGIDLNGDGTSDVFYDLYSIDTDLDGIKDTCDADADGNGTVENGPDQNGDEYNDNMWDPADNDLDLLPNHVDPNDSNPDSDGDGIPDGADADVNGDGILDNGCDSDGDGIHDVADSDDNPSDGQTDLGNQDDDLDGIDNAWDLIDDGMAGRSINYIISPNGDGVNETLYIQGIQLIERHELVIFNRYGEPVYRSIDYNNDWSGEINLGITPGENMLMDGVYYYTLDLGNGEEFVRGYIEIRH